MTSKNASHIVCASLFALTLALTATASASHEKLLHVFNGTPAKFASSGLVADPAGDLFGTTQGVVYELSPASGGGFTYQVITNLPGGSADQAAGNLARDAAGNLYGTTNEGGANGCGYIYELSPHSGTAWTLNTLHAFVCQDGFGAATLILDTGGNLYGGALNGGTFTQGVAYELSPGAGGLWSYQTLHNFSNAEGNGPQTGLVFDASGNLYGGNETGIFKLTPDSGGTWTESTAFSFNNSTDGFDPHGDLIIDSTGNIYGTNEAGGPNFSGTAFELSPTSGGGWTITVLHGFGKPGDGATPFAGLTPDAAGNLYGTTAIGGGPSNAGTAFKLSLVGGVWQENILYRFLGAAANDGSGPQYPLYLKSNTLYGTTNIGGNAACSGGCGTVFAIK